ncbi:hypothetical protein [Pseudomonas putida]|uniref:Uncharacterized protein n=1 Tax=Pseudomonas putida TaxID=303 RepID=A0A7V8EJ78_PSEPU|nr:hypothetical protein [Pseudomonas putida]KAF0255786.1 hypothetical protein GN299_06755 [Pseudomonas putida]
MGTENDEVMGLCALCGPDNGEVRVLRKSHFLPKAVYRYFNNFRAEGTKLLLRSEEQKKIFSMRRQIFQSLLCDTCEGHMSSEGEDYYSKMVLKIDTENELPSPVYRILINGLLPSWNAPTKIYGPSLILSVGSNLLPSIESQKLYHFAIGMFWKATFENWEHCQAIPLERDLIDEMRRFLRGGDYPRGHIVRIVPSLWRAKYGVAFPTLVNGQPFFSIQQFDFYLEKSDRQYWTALSMNAVPLLYTVDSMRSEHTFRGMVANFNRTEKTQSTSGTTLSWLPDQTS